MVKKVVIFSTHDQALSYRKQLAAQGGDACFGVTATTYGAWLSDAWELYGDGRVLVSSLDRSFAVHALLERSSESGELELTDGGISLVCRFFSDTVGLDELDAAVANLPASLSSQEREVLRLVQPYRALLEERGFVEAGDALNVLSQMSWDISFSFAGGVDIPPVLAQFMDRTGIASDLLGEEEGLVTGLPEGVSPQFLFGSGPSAEHALVASYVGQARAALQQSGRAGSVLAVSARPHRLYESLSEALGPKGCECVLRARRPFTETVFGRAYMAIREFILDSRHDPRALMDFASSPFSGISGEAAAKIDASVRGDRALSFEELQAMMHLVTETYDLFEELVSDADASLLLDRFVDLAEELKGLDAATVFEQQIAIMALRSVYESARRWSVEPDAFSFALSALSVDASRTCGSGPCRVTVLDAAQAATLSSQERFDVVVYCDLDARYVSASEPHNALVTLEEKLGIAVSRHALKDARCAFERVKASAKRYFACERVLNAGGDEDIYPSFVLDEYCECLREEGEELDAFGVPEHLSSFAVTRDEGGSRSTYAANYQPSGEDPGSITIPGFAPGGIGDALKPLLSLFRAPDDPDAVVLSPSAIEEYVNCPYRWFAARRLRPEAPDELLGPLEQGVFVHAVWESFYRSLEQGIGEKRVTPGNLEKAQRHLALAFDEELARQPQAEGVRYLPLTPTEHAQAARLRQTLIENLGVQARLLPRFVPQQFELSIEPDQGIDYAGVRLMGRVDRVDVDAERGHYAVIDYKGGVAGHDAGFDPDEQEEFSTPSKVQALIYAQALRRKMGSARPVGALYLSYRAKEPAGSLAGSFDSAMLDATGFARNAAAVNMNFESYLDLVEVEIAKRVANLLDGDIAPNPLCAASCKYCPVRFCEKRLS